MNFYYLSEIMPHSGPPRIPAAMYSMLASVSSVALEQTRSNCKQTSHRIRVSRKNQSDPVNQIFPLIFVYTLCVEFINREKAI